MKKIYLIILLFLVNLYKVDGQSGRFITGSIVDSLSQKPIKGATININYGSVMMKSEADGSFQFYNENREMVLMIKHVGYRTWRKTIEANFKGAIKVNLTEIANDLEEVIISSKVGNTLVKRPLLGVNSLNIKALAKIPSALGEIDILRGLQLLPGVTSVGEASNGLNIRGGATDQNLMLLDDSPIFNPTHMFGLFSAFPTETLSSFDLYKGNVPARFGGRAAAVLEVNLSNPSLEKFSMSGGISFVSNKLKLDIPIIKDKLGIVIAGRGAFNDFILPWVSPKLNNIRAKFGDASSKIFYKINQKQTLTLSSYYSYDFFQTNALGTINEINSQNTQFQYSTFNNALSWFYSINKKMNIQTKFISSEYLPQTILPEVNSTNKVRIKSRINYKQVKSNVNYFTDKQKIEIGISGIKYQLMPGQLDPGSNLNVKSINTPSENAYELGLYADDEIEINPRFTASAGLRYSYFMNVGPTNYRNYSPNQPITDDSVIDTVSIKNHKIVNSYGGFEPRLGLSFQLNKHSSIKAGYNLMRQYLQVITNTTTPLPTSRWKTSDLYLKPQVSSLYTIGYFQDFDENIYEYSIETYYRFTKNIVDYKAGADFLFANYPETQLLQGVNKSYGLELMLSKKKGELTGWINYTYSRSFNKVNASSAISDQINGGNWYKANYDRPHSFNATVVINQGKHHDFSFNFTYSTGRPYSTPQGFIQYQGNTYPFYSERNNARLPDYHRLDFSWNIYNPSMNEKRRWKGNWNFTVYNLYGRENAYSIFLQTKGTIITANKLVIFGAPIVSLAYNFKFL